MNNKIIAKNDVLKVKEEDYIKLRDKLVDKLSLVPQIKSIYQMGGWTQPGISDLDIIVVTKSGDVDYKIVDISRNELCENDIERYILMHSPFVIPDKVFPEIDSIFYCSDLKLLHGTNIPIKKYNVINKNISEIYKLVSVLIHTIPRFYFLANDISLRSFLTFSYSLKHSYKILQVFDNDFKDKIIENYIKSISDLRRNVIEGDYSSSVDITSMVKQGRLVCKILFSNLEVIIKNNYNIDNNPSSNIFYIKNLQIAIKFTSSNNYKITNNGKFNIFELPELFAAFILFPIDDYSEITKFQNKNTIGSFDIDLSNELTDNLFRRKGLFDIYRNLLLESKVINGMPFELNTSLFWNKYSLNIFSLQSIKGYLYRKKLYYSILSSLKNI